MKIIIREAKIIDPKSPFHHQVVDVKIKDGILEKIGKNLAKDSDYEEITHPDLHLSQGWMDSSVSLGEPGFEDRETIANGLQVAAKSGFTAITLQPNSFPVLDNQSQIQFVKQKATIGVINRMETISPLLNNNIKKELRNNIKIPDASAADAESKKSNDILTHDAYSKLLIILDIGLTIGFILCIMYKHSFIKVLGLNLIIVTLVGLTEYVFLNFIPKNFIPIDTNFIRFTILTKLKSKITINNKKLD